MTKKQKVLFIILATVLIVSVMTVTYAFFTINVANDSNAITVTTTEVANLRMTSMNSEIGNPLYPGWVGYYAIDVSATRGGSGIYNLSLNVTGGTNVKDDVMVEICKIENSTVALAQDQISFTPAEPQIAATAAVPGEYHYFMIDGEVTLPYPCEQVLISSLSGIGNNLLISLAGGKEIQSGRHDRYYIKLNYMNDSRGPQVKGESFAITPNIVPVGGITQSSTIVDGSAASVLKSKANPISNNSYSWSESDEQKEMYTFSHIPTAQTVALTDYRYIGDSPNNYAYFNCTDTTDTSTCETWRIIGVFPVDAGNGNYVERIKLVREDNIGDYHYSNSGNQWINSTLANILNSGDYYTRSNSFSSTGLTDNAKSLIGNAKWYLSVPVIYVPVYEDYKISGYESISSGPVLYYNERGTHRFDSGTTYTTSYSVGLIYPSDYAYTFAYEVDDTCFSYLSDCSFSYNYSWMDSFFTGWTISPSDTFVDAYNISDSHGYSDYLSFIYTEAFYSEYVHPAVYLLPNVELDPNVPDQDGSSSNPYMFKITTS